MNDARRILMKRATDDGLDGNDAGDFVRLRLKNLGYNEKKITNQTRPAASSTEKD
jgi:hypothetical protein